MNVGKNVLLTSDYDLSKTLCFSTLKCIDNNKEHNQESTKLT